MILALALLVALQIEQTDQDNAVLRNRSEKTITAFSYKVGEVTYRTDLRNVEGIQPDGVYILKTKEPISITSVVFSDETIEGDDAKQILARRKGIGQAEKVAAYQIRQFLKVNSVIDDNALAALDRELDQTVIVLPTYMTEKEKTAWNEGYISTRLNIRERIKEVPTEYRLRQLKLIGGEDK